MVFYVGFGREDDKGNVGGRNIVFDIVREVDGVD